METKLSSATKELTISYDHPTVLIGERLNPTGRKKLAEALKSGDLEFVRQDARSQVEANADMLDVNVGTPGVDEVSLLPEVIQTVTGVTDVPLCIDSSNPKALEAALTVYQGKALVNSVTGEEKSLEEILPVVKKYGAAVVGLTMDAEGVPTDAGRRVTIAERIIERAESAGIPRQDIVIDCLNLAVASDNKAALAVIEAIRRIRATFGLNQTLGGSNISFGMPDRDLINTAFLTLAVEAGVTCPIVDAAKVRPAILAADMVLGRDSYGRRYIQAYRQRQRRA